MSNNFNTKVITASLIVMIHTMIFGIFSIEVWRFSQSLSYRLTEYGYEYTTLVLTLLYLPFLFFYLSFRGFKDDARRVILSFRFDLLVGFGLGIWIDIAWGSFFSKTYENLISSLTFTQSLTITLIPLAVGLPVLLRSIFLKKDQGDSALIADKELEEADYDLLNFREKAERFAETVFNRGASESFVFGVDSPWGIGKSTFVNFCIEHWDQKYHNKTVVYKFSPLRYTSEANLLDVFIDGLIGSIQRNSFVPEIRPLISRYSRFLKEVHRFSSFFGFNVPFFGVDYTVDEAFDDLSILLNGFNKKVIIVIDDLDRISFSEIKDILFVVRKTFALPNISYVLCYDTDNIGTLETKNFSTDTVSEFLEKFINLKISLYLDRKDLEAYVTENFYASISKSLVDPKPIRLVIGGLLAIFRSPEYHNYLPFLGDIRKLKRLINMVIMFDSFTLREDDFENDDIDIRDLIHLLLIYIHYPDIFRKIYDTEIGVDSKQHFFSAVTEYDSNFPQGSQGAPSKTYENSTDYTDFIKGLDKPQIFLLNQVFEVKARLKKAGLSNQRSAVSEELLTSLACFNGGMGIGKNLEMYLHLILKLSKPEHEDQYRFYTIWRDKISKGSTTIQNVLLGSKFALDKGEKMREKLWRILVNSAHGFSHDTGRQLIVELKNTIHHYSLVEVPSITTGLRRNMDYKLARLLNDAGWIDASGNHRGNTEEAIKEIAEWVFGEDRHVGEGILESLSQPDRGILGLYDLMAFRLFCNADRGGDIFNLTRALSKHSDKGAPVEGSTSEITKEEMREISQRVFQIFSEQYIAKDRNIFSEIGSLKVNELLGEYKDLVTGPPYNTDLEKDVAVNKNTILNFLVYQIGNTSIENGNGIGCGFYDLIGHADQQEIKSVFNEYLFGLCFNPAVTERNFEYFLNYLLMNFGRTYDKQDGDGVGYLPTTKEFIKVLDKKKLVDYWKAHQARIRQLNFPNQSNTILTGNYSATYRDDLPAVYDKLDELAEEK